MAGVTYGAGGTEFTGTGDVTPPSVPTFSVAPGTNSVVVTIDGDAGVTNYVKYKTSSGTSWSDGGSRSGDGDVTISNLDNDTPYIIEVYSVDAAGLNSTPGVAVITTLSVDSTNDADDELDDMAVEILSAFGEPVTYYPSGGGSRAIAADIIRDPPVRFEGTSRAYAPFMVVSVANDATTGISSSEIDKGGDKIDLPVKKGEIAQKRPLVQILTQDAGMLRLEVR